MRDDLAEAPLLIALRSGLEGAPLRLILQGLHLSYRLTEYRTPRYQTSASWEFAQTESFDAQAPASVNIIGQMALDPHSLDVMTAGTALESYPRLRGKLASWDQLKQRLEEKGAPIRAEDRFRRALSLSLMLEMAFAAADTFPVQIFWEQRQGGGRRRTRSKIEASERPRSRAVNKSTRSFRSLADRLDQMLTTDDMREEAIWRLTDIRQLGDRGWSDTEWRFQEIRQYGGQPVYVFSGPGSSALAGRTVLGSIG